VSFEQGTFYEGNGELPNGPSSVKTEGEDFFGLGFTVSGRVSGGAGVGKIGDDTNPENPKGKWMMYQFADRIESNGQVHRNWPLHDDLN